MQSNPYGNLKIKPSAHGPKLFSADANVSTSSSQVGTDDTSLQSLLAVDSSYIGGGGTFRARAAGSLSASRSRPLARDRGQSNRSTSLNTSITNSSSMMRTAKASPMPILSMSQPRGVVEYSNDKFSEMLNRSLQQDKLASSQLENTRSPATNKENDHTQAGHSKEERSDGVLDGVSRDDTLNISHEHHGASSGAGGFGRHPRTIPYEHTSESSAAGVFGRMSNGFGTSSDRSVANRFGGFGGSSVDNTTSAASNGLGDGISNGNGFGDSYVRGSMGHSAQHGPGSEASASAHGDSMSEANGKGDEKWTWKYQNYTFTADREPKGLEIPENFTVHKVFDRDQVGIRMLVRCIAYVPVQSDWSCAQVLLLFAAWMADDVFFFLNRVRRLGMRAA